MTTMKTRALLFGIALGAIALSSCSNDDNTKDQKEETQGVHFTIIEEGFGADTELPRATPSTQPQIIEAGDCEAEISIERAPAEKLVATRAVTTPVHYTIRAYHNGTLRGEMKGTFTPTGFTPDAGYSAQMELGRNRTYDFVCFNDKVTPNGNNLDVTLANAKDARIGRQSIAIGTTDQTINLSSKHVGCRIQTQVVAKKDIPSALTSTIESIGATIPQTVSYNPATNTYTTTATTTMAAIANNSPASTETKYTASNYGQNYSYTSSAPYLYFLPGMDVANLKLNNLSGTIFWKPFNMNIANLSKTSKLLETNGSYTAKIKMKPQFTYLMSDGTIGYFKDTTFGGAPAATAKTPIAVVVNTNLHMAIALNNAINYGTVSWRKGVSYQTQANTHAIMTGDWSDAFNSQATSGLDETWDASYSTGSFGVKATNPKFPPFNFAANYDPGVAYTGSPALQWYLPSYNDFRYLYPLGCGDETTIHSPFVSYKWYGNLANSAFTQVGGTTVLYTYFHTSTEYKYSYEYLYGCLDPRPSGLIFNHGGSTTGSIVRSFVAY